MKKGVGKVVAVPPYWLHSSCSTLTTPSGFGGGAFFSGSWPATTAPLCTALTTWNHYHYTEKDDVIHNLNVVILL